MQLAAGRKTEVEMTPEPQIIYEDKNFAAVNKPAGLLVHGTRSAKYAVCKNHAAQNTQQAAKKSLYAACRMAHGTLVDWLLERYPEIAAVGDDPETRPGIVHRLDRDASGVMLVAKNQKYFEYLKSLFQKRQIKKTYLALVWGELEQKRGAITKPIGIKSGTTKRSVHSQKMAKEAVTEYRVIKYIGDKRRKTNDSGFPRSSAPVARQSALTLLEVYPKTGRTHQIRVHLASIGHPIIGDTLYGTKVSRRLLPAVCRPPKRLMLHALSLELAAEDGRRFVLEAGPPKEFTNI